FSLLFPPSPPSPLFPYTTLFRSHRRAYPRRRRLVANDSPRARGGGPLRGSPPDAPDSRALRAPVRRRAARAERARTPTGHPGDDTGLRNGRVLRHDGGASRARRVVIDPHTERGTNRPVRDGGRDDRARSVRVGCGPVDRRVAWEGLGGARAGWQRDGATAQPLAD